MRNRLSALFRANAKRGCGLRAETSDERVTIWLYDAIAGSSDDAYWWGGTAPEELALAFASARGRPVLLRVNTPGGDVFGGRAMQQIIREHDAEVVAQIDGLAASAGSYLIQGATRVTMAEGSMLMIHKAWGIAIGNSIDMLAYANLLDKIDGTLAETYTNAAAKRGADAADFAALMAAETWMTAAEAIAFGLADEQLGGTTAAAAMWNLSAYENAPAALNVPHEPARPTEPEPEAAVEDVAAIAAPDTEHERRRLRARLAQTA